MLIYRRVRESPTGCWALDASASRGAEVVARRRKPVRLTRKDQIIMGSLFPVRLVRLSEIEPAWCGVFIAPGISIGAHVT